MSFYEFKSKVDEILIVVVVKIFWRDRRSVKQHWCSTEFILPAGLKLLRCINSESQISRVSSTHLYIHGNIQWTLKSPHNVYINNSRGHFRCRIYFIIVWPILFHLSIFFFPLNSLNYCSLFQMFDYEIMRYSQFFFSAHHKYIICLFSLLSPIKNLILR